LCIAQRGRRGGEDNLPARDRFPLPPCAREMERITMEGVPAK
jgi:hypothetical protein